MLAMILAMSNRLRIANLYLYNISHALVLNLEQTIYILQDSNMLHQISLQGCVLARVSHLSLIYSTYITVIPNTWRIVILVYSQIYKKDCLMKPTIS